MTPRPSVPRQVNPSFLKTHSRYQNTTTNHGTSTPHEYHEHHENHRSWPVRTSFYGISKPCWPRIKQTGTVEHFLIQTKRHHALAATVTGPLLGFTSRRLFILLNESPLAMCRPSSSKCAAPAENIARRTELGNVGARRIQRSWITEL